ncbi:hypothetical protein [Pseudomonas aeruginosa]|nr:hypothetical protein [Pseudomonas aeruginosa]
MPDGFGYCAGFTADIRNSFSHMKAESEKKIAVARLFSHPST